MMMDGGMHGGGIGVMLVMAVLIVIPFWRICRRLGYPGFLGILAVVPILNLVFFYYLAFARWPIADSAGLNPDSDGCVKERD